MPPNIENSGILNLVLITFGRFLEGLTQVSNFPILLESRPMTGPARKPRR
jgi:hypothetical protein